MERKSVKVSKSNPLIKAILAVSFPAWKGRKLSVELSDKPVYLDVHASGGSWDEAVAVRLSDGISAGVPRVSPFSSAYSAMVNEGVSVPEGVVLVVHSHFCGQDAGIRIHVSPASLKFLNGANLAGLLPASSEVL